MTQALLEEMKILASISISEKTPDDLRGMAIERIKQMFPLIDDDIEQMVEHIAMEKQQMREAKFKM
jgi:hypothetical protein